MDNNPYRVVSSRPVYDNPWIQVNEHQIVLPSGKPGIYGVVSFKNRAVGVVPYEDGRIWLVGQYRFPLGCYSWEIPEGGVPRDEDLMEGARRELLEETGLVAATLEPLLEMHLSNSVSDEYGIVYLARGLIRGNPCPEESEELRVRQVTLEEAYADVCAGRITDSLTVAAVFRMMLLKREGSI